MIRRHPPRHRGQHQDFHLFADPTRIGTLPALRAFAGIERSESKDPILLANIESQFCRVAAAPPSRRPLAMQLDSPVLTGVIDVPPGVQTRRALIDTLERLECDLTH